MGVTLERIDEILEQYDEWQNEADRHLVDAMTENIELPPKPKFEVTDKSSAEWVLKRIAQDEAVIKENNAIVTEQTAPLRAEIAKYEDWAAQENKRLQEHIEFMKAWLRPYYMVYLETKNKSAPKTLTLPHGKMINKAQDPEIKRDEKKAVETLKASGLTQFVKSETVETVKWNELKPLTKTANGKVVHVETGSILDGFTAIDRPDKFEVVTS